MNIQEIQEKWGQFKDQREFQQRLDPSHPLDFFVGIDAEGCEELIFLTKEEPENIRSTVAIKVEKKVRKDGLWATRIALQDNSYLDIFSKLCLDLLEVSKDVKSEQEGIKLVVQRYMSWIKIFTNINTLLSTSVLKGLMGELNFILYLNGKKIQIDEIIDAWLGPTGADRDFILQNNWFEIKSIATGKNVITISSLNQLETDKKGYIVKYNIDPTSKNDPYAVSVASVVTNVRDLLRDSPNAQEEFERKLLEIGYVDKKDYQNIYFSISFPEFFSVNNKFPKLVSKNVPKEVVAVTYDLSLVGIDPWKENEEDIWN